MDVLKFGDYEGTAEVCVSRGVCHGKILFITDLVTYQSETVAGLQKEFEAAVEDYIETCAAIGKEPQRPFRGQFQVRVPPDLHRKAALRATAEDASLNEIICRALEYYLCESPSVNHTYSITFEAPIAADGTFELSASGPTKWGKVHATH